MLETIDFETMRKELLNKYKSKQNFRVSIGIPTTNGKGKAIAWVNYEAFKAEYNLREILKDEIVIEFDCDDLETVFHAYQQTGLNLYHKGYNFELWDHGGRSPHIHIKNIPIGDKEDSERVLFKKLFIRKVVPLEYLKYVDFSLTGEHLIAIEWAKHWKGKCGVKMLKGVFNENPH